MDTILFTVHPEWIPESEAPAYRNLCAALRSCIARLQYQNPDWELVVIQSGSNTLAASLRVGHRFAFLNQLYKMAGEFVRVDAQIWLQVSPAPLPGQTPSPKKAPVPKDIPPSAASPAVPEAPRYLEELCRQPIGQEYPAIRECLRSHGNMIRMLRKMGLTDNAWDQNLLVAIDDNGDFDAFLSALYQVYRREGLVSAHEDYTSSTTVSSWERAAACAESFARQTDRERTDILLVIDVRRAGFERDSQKIRNALRCISSMKKRFLCIFRTQVMETGKLEEMLDEINDMMPVYPVVAPPAGMDTLLECFQTLLREANCPLSPGCGRLMEQWIQQELLDSDSHGYELASRMVRELILHKAQANLKTGIPDNTITPEDILACMKQGAGAAPQNAREQLEALIGVAEIKKRIPELAAQIKVQQELAKQGVDRPAVHMMFTGNPGTGKTLVARIIASILKEEGILSKGLLFEVNARELCGQHVGETAPKVSAKCREAYGSVLFVDEAYMLYQNEGSRDYGPEAIATLMTEMENHREDFCVIFAGYPADMERLMSANPGLRSRIPYTIHFPNYSREELTDIFFRMLENRFAYDESLRSAAEAFFRSIPDEVMARPDFSNARMVRNLYERVWGKAAYRKIQNGESELVLRGEDLTAAVEEADFLRLMASPKQKRTIGFAR